MSMTDPSRHVTEEKLGRLSAWARRKPRIALLGEFSSGKSTLLNLLIGADLLPTKVTATELPPVWFSHGRPRAFWVDRQGGQHPMTFGDFGGVPMSARYVRVFTSSPMLERCDIIDTPGISDPNLDEESWRFAVGQSNFILWCTPATQAWRETERSAWTSLPERLRANSVLVVTRADKLLNATDRDKVTRRLTRESFGLFGDLVLLSAPDAVRGKAVLAQSNDWDLWTQSGGADLEARIDAGLRSVAAERLLLLKRYVSTGPTPRLEAAAGQESAAHADETAPLLDRLQALAEPVQPRRVARRSAVLAIDPSPVGGQPRPSTPCQQAADQDWHIKGEAQQPGAGWSPSAGVPSDREDIDAMIGAVLGDAPAPAGPATTASGYAPPLGLDPDGSEDDPLQAVLAAINTPDASAAGVDGSSSILQESLPRAVRIWRDIVKRNPDVPSNDPVLAMIEQLLFELSHDEQSSGGVGAGSGAFLKQDKAA